MASANGTLSRTKSKPELFALFLFKYTSNWRLLLAFLLVFSLTAISITFNVMLGNLSGSDDMSKTILPIGYALLDLSALFLSGYIGLRSIGVVTLNRTPARASLERRQEQPDNTRRVCRNGRASCETNNPSHSKSARA